MCCAWLAFACLSFLAAEDSGGVTGKVTDATDAKIPHARVTLRNSNGRDAAQTLTDDAGRYRFSKVAAGIYDLEFESPGFKSAALSGIRVHAAAESVGATVKLAVAPLYDCPVYTRKAPAMYVEPITAGTSEIEGRVAPSRVGRQIAHLRLVTGVGRSNTVFAGADGRFVFSGIQPGSYRLVAQLRGHADFVIDRLEVQDHKRTVIRDTLEVIACPKRQKCLLRTRCPS